MVVFAPPFDGAADGVGLRHLHIAPGHQIINGVGEFVGVGEFRFAWGIVHAADVTEGAVAVEKEKVRGLDGPVGFGRGLGVIAEARAR